jgi:hypothetical protein
MGRGKGLQSLQDAVLELEVFDALAVHHHEDLYKEIE